MWVEIDCEWGCPGVANYVIKSEMKTEQKEEYIAPRFAVLTSDQSKLRLTGRALPGEITTEQLLRAASQLVPESKGVRCSAPK